LAEFDKEFQHVAPTTGHGQASPRVVGVNYMDLDEQKFSDPNPPLQLIKDTLAEMGR